MAQSDAWQGTLFLSFCGRSLAQPATKIEDVVVFYKIEQIKRQIQTGFEKMLHRVRCRFNQTKMETFSSYAHLGTNQAHFCSSKNSLYAEKILTV